MAKVVVSEFLSLDGVMEDPGGAEGFEHGGWALRFDRGPEGDAFKLDELLAAELLLLGRRTYEGFAEAWPSRTDEVGFAEKMNTMPKLVVSTSLQRAEWNNARVLRGALIEEVAALRRQPVGEILVVGSGELVAALLEAKLVDELRLMLFPVILGGGRRLFDGTNVASTLRLREARPVGPAGVMILIYEPHRGERERPGGDERGGASGRR